MKTSVVGKRITNTFDLTQLVKGPTRVTCCSKTQIDLVLSNKPERVTKSFNMVTGLSDLFHHLISQHGKSTSVML